MDELKKIIESEQVVKENLDKYTVYVPNFSIKKSKMERLANWAFSATTTPFPDKGYTIKGMNIILYLPIILVTIMFLSFSIMS